MTTAAATLQSAVTGLLIAVLTLLYWEVKARAARARTQALRDEVASVPEKTATAVAASTSSDSALAGKDEGTAA